MSGEANMKWMVGSLMAAMLAAPAMAMSPADPVAGPVARGVLRACLDARGLDADCGVDPPEMHECFASDRFGRCPGDPTCFDAKGRQARCTWPVVRRDGPCFNGQVVSPSALPPSCRKG
jgi:hypothetical protein